MRILISGAAGRVGQMVTPVLSEAGYTILGVDRVMPNKRDHMTFRVVDLLNREICYDLLENVEAVIHLAAWPSAGRTDDQTLLKDNVSMTVNLLHAAKDLGIKTFIGASSIQTITRKRPERWNSAPSLPTIPYLPADGNTPANPSDNYGLSKQLCEEIMRSYSDWYDMTCVAMRFPSVVSERWLPRVRRHIHNTGYLCLDELFTAITGSDLGRLMDAILKANLTGYRCYFPTCLKPLSDLPIPELIQTHYPDIPLRKPLDEMAGLVDISRITAETGWVPQNEILDMALALESS